MHTLQRLEYFPRIPLIVQAQQAEATRHTFTIHLKHI